MHEISICFELIKTLRTIADENDVKDIDTVVLEIGELSSVIPTYMHECWPMAVDDTEFVNTALKIETIAGLGRCRQCDHLYALLPNNGICNNCQSTEFDLLGGREFNIKEIIVIDEE